MDAGRGGFFKPKPSLWMFIRLAPGFAQEVLKPPQLSMA